jgi:hypothetical protein
VRGGQRENGERNGARSVPELIKKKKRRMDKEEEGAKKQKVEA